MYSLLTRLQALDYRRKGLGPGYFDASLAIRTFEKSLKREISNQRSKHRSGLKQTRQLQEAIGAKMDGLAGAELARSLFQPDLQRRETKQALERRLLNAMRLALADKRTRKRLARMKRRAH